MSYHLMIIALREENSEPFFFFLSKADANIHLMQEIKSILALGFRNMSKAKMPCKNSVICVQHMMGFALYVCSWQNTMRKYGSDTEQ